MKKYLYKVSNTQYKAEEIFTHKHVEENEDIIEIKILRVPISDKNKEGISYSLVYIRKGERIIGFDNFEGHEKDGNCHHKHIKDRIVPYEFVDEWKLIGDFNAEVEKIKKEIL